MDKTYIADNTIYDIEFFCGITLSENQTHRIIQVIFDYGEDIFEYAKVKTLDKDFKKEFETTEHLTNYFCKIAKEKFLEEIEGENK